MVSGSPGSKKEQGCLSVESSQASAWGNLLQSVRVGTHFMLRVAINREPLHSQGNYSPSRGPASGEAQGDTPLLLWVELPRPPAGLLEVGVLKLGHVPDIKKTLGHSLGEHSL